MLAASVAARRQRIVSEASSLLARPSRTSVEEAARSRHPACPPWCALHQANAQEQRCLAQCEPDVSRPSSGGSSDAKQMQYLQNRHPERGWSGRPDSNWGPLAPKASALPAAPRPDDFEYAYLACLISREERLGYPARVLSKCISRPFYVQRGAQNAGLDPFVGGEAFGTREALTATPDPGRRRS
jgi:hypothetical protein